MATTKIVDDDWLSLMRGQISPFPSTESSFIAGVSREIRRLFNECPGCGSKSGLVKVVPFDNEDYLSISISCHGMVCSRIISRELLAKTDSIYEALSGLSTELRDSWASKTTAERRRINKAPTLTNPPLITTNVNTPNRGVTVVSSSDGGVIPQYVSGLATYDFSALPFTAAKPDSKASPGRQKATIAPLADNQKQRAITLDD